MAACIHNKATDITRIFNIWLALGLVVVAMLVAVYFQALSGPFLIDDYTSVFPARMSEFSWSELWRVATGDTSGIFGRFIPVLSFALNSFVAGEGAFSYKLVNLCIHVLNFSLIYYFCSLLFQNISVTSKELSTNEAACLALICSALWALHPMQVSTVMYVVQRMAMMSATFTLCALIVYLKYRNDLHSLRGRITWISSIACFTVLACICKESGALIILYIALLEFLLVPQSLGVVKAFVQRTNRYQLVATSVLFVVLFFYKLPEFMSGYQLRDFGLYERVITEIQIVPMFYLKNIIFPDLDELSIYHDGLVAMSSIDVRFLFSLFVICTLLALVFVLRKRLTVVSFGIALFLISHVMESTILPLELVFEHRNYLGMLGVVMALGYGSYLFYRVYLKQKALLVFLSGLSVLALSQQTYVRSIEWSSEASLLSAAIENKPASLRVKMGVTAKLASEGRLEELLVHLDSSIIAHPDNSLFSVQKVMFIGALGRKDPVALEQASERLSILPLRTTDLIGLNELYKFRESGRFMWPSMDEVADLFSAAAANENLRIRPDAKSGLDNMYATILTDLDL